MAEPFLVAIRCPQCGAGTDFPEGSYALRCAYCGVTLRVLGARRGGRARYLMQPAVEARGLGTVLATYARERGRRLESVEWRTLLLAPFWRARGAALRWVYYRAASRDDSLLETMLDLDDAGRAGYDGGLGWMSAGAGRRSRGARRDERAFQTRHVDLSFPGFEPAADLGLQSLGIRPGVRPLRVLAADAVPDGARLLPLALDAAAALARVERTADDGFEDLPGERLFERTAVLVHSLSPIYFPFWIASGRIDGAERLLVVDAVAGSVVREGEPSSPWLARLAALRSPRLSGSSLGFLPMKCPECGWPLPLETRAIVHLCTNCGRAWRDEDGRLTRVPYDAVPARGAALYLPAWRFEAQVRVEGKLLAGAAELPRLLRPAGWPVPAAAGDGRPIALYVPAFECRALPVLERLATALTRLQPRELPSGVAGSVPKLPLSPAPRAIGAFIEAGDAAALARLFLVGLLPGAGAAARRRLEALAVELGPAQLVWLPADDRGRAVQDRLTRTTLPKASLGWESGDGTEAEAGRRR